MGEALIMQPQQQPRRISLYDSSGLPWTTRLSLGWIIFMFAVTGGLAALPIALSLGAWIRAKTRSAVVLGIYVLLSGTCVLLFLPGSMTGQKWADALGLCVLVLWFAGALIARYQIGRYYTLREGSEFRLSLACTLIFGVWYLNYRIRPEFPSSSEASPAI